MTERLLKSGSGKISQNLGRAVHLCKPFTSIAEAQVCRHAQRRSTTRTCAQRVERGDGTPKKERSGKRAPSSSNGAPIAAPLHAKEEALMEEDLEDETGLGPCMNAVVKVFCVHTEPNYSLPWQRKRQYTSGSSGFIVEGPGGKPCLLTNAHSVDYHTQVKVKKRGDDRKYLARVLSIGIDCDIAMLTVDDEEFWEDVVPLQFGSLPRLQDSVAVVGYPVGGDTISVTVGVVSRIEVTHYTHGSTDLLCVQIDAAINSGNSGGPVFNSMGQCVGIAFQSLAGSDVENVGYVIPVPVVHHFLTDYERHTTFTGFPALGIQWQRMESEALRKAFTLPKERKGILVRSVNPTAYAASALQRDDIIMRFDGTEISNDGTVPFRTGERIAFSYLVSNKFVGDTAQLDILRGGEQMSLEVKLSKPNHLVPPHISNRDPSYLMVAGLVFTCCCQPYLESEYGPEFASEAPVKLLDRMFHTYPQERGEEVVVLSQVLASEVTLGYEEIYNVQVKAFNSVPVRSLAQLAGAVITCTEPYMRFDLEHNEVVVIDAAEARAVAPSITAMHSIPHTMSADLRAALLPADQAAGTVALAAASEDGVEVEPVAPVRVGGKARR